MFDGEPQPDAPCPLDEAKGPELMERLRLGDASAFDELLGLYWQPLVAYGAALLGSVDAGEDVAQEAFIRAWQRRAEWQPRGSVRSYLYRITRNLALNEQRRRTIRKRWLEHRRGDTPRPNPTPLQILEGDELSAGIERAIEALPERRREVFVLARFHDLSYRQIAEVMEISPQTVANQMSAALSELRQSLAHWMDEMPRPR